MCEIVENYAKEVAKEAAKEASRGKEKSMAKKLFEMGVDFNVVLHSAENLSAEELRAIYEDIRNNV